jgi:hypothetical protein
VQLENVEDEIPFFTASIAAVIAAEVGILPSRVLVTVIDVSVPRGRRAVQAVSGIDVSVQIVAASSPSNVSAVKAASLLAGKLRDSQSSIHTRKVYLSPASDAATFAAELIGSMFVSNAAGEELAPLDCMGAVNGKASIDTCGVCEGDGSSCQEGGSWQGTTSAADTTDDSDPDDAASYAASWLVLLGGWLVLLGSFLLTKKFCKCKRKGGRAVIGVEIDDETKRRSTNWKDGRSIGLDTSAMKYIDPDRPFSRGDAKHRQHNPPSDSSDEDVLAVSASAVTMELKLCKGCRVELINTGRVGKCVQDPTGAPSDTATTIKIVWDDDGSEGEVLCKDISTLRQPLFRPRVTGIDELRSNIGSRRHERRKRIASREGEARSADASVAGAAALASKQRPRSRARALPSVGFRAGTPVSARLKALTERAVSKKLDQEGHPNPAWPTPLLRHYYVPSRQEEGRDTLEISTTFVHNKLPPPRGQQLKMHRAGRKTAISSP